MKIQYQYTEYKDFPEATEVSETRARMAVVFAMMLAPCVLLSLIFLFAFEGIWNRIFSAIFLLLSLGGFYYLRNYYPKVTEKKIQKAIQNKIEFENEIRSSKYKCKYIQLYDKFSTGTCQSCYEKNLSLTLCKIKSDVGTREIYICRNCIQKYKSTAER